MPHPHPIHLSPENPPPVEHSFGLSIAFFLSESLFTANAPGMGSPRSEQDLRREELYDVFVPDRCEDVDI